MRCFFCGHTIYNEVCFHPEIDGVLCRMCSNRTLERVRPVFDFWKADAARLERYARVEMATQGFSSMQDRIALFFEA